MKMWVIFSTCNVRDNGWKCCLVQRKAGQVVALVFSCEMVFLGCINYTTKKTDMTTIFKHLMDASDSCQEGDFSWKTVQTLFKNLQSCDWLIQTLIHLYRKPNQRLESTDMQNCTELWETLSVVRRHLCEVQISIDKLLLTESGSELFLSLTVQTQPTQK